MTSFMEFMITALKCSMVYVYLISGLTWMNYRGLNALIEEINDPDFVVVGIPCNNFGLQEPGLNEELMNGIREVRPGQGFVPKFNLTKKADVNGEDELSLYTFLKVFS